MTATMALRMIVAAVLDDLARMKHKIFDTTWEAVYIGTIRLFRPLDALLCAVLKNRVRPRSVVHVSYLGHVPYCTTEILRADGIAADYVAIGENPHWSKCDYHLERFRVPVISAVRDWLFFWRVMARYEVVHSHFMKSLSFHHWELPLLKRLGRRVVVHFRGCEARERTANMALHPDLNICQDCDYEPYLCLTPENRRGRHAARRYADSIIVTTPDLRDFWPDARHMPFLVPPNLPDPPRREPWDSASARPFRIVHVTNHPGIEGTHQITRAVAALIRDGWPIDFVNLRGVSHERVLAEFADADLAIGKMKMGYYANAQVESMALGVPTITWVREEFMTRDLEESGFIFTTLDSIKETIDDMMRHPEKLAAKRERARTSVLKLHDNAATVAEMCRLYGWNAGPS